MSIPGERCFVGSKPGYFRDILRSVAGVLYMQVLESWAVFSEKFAQHPPITAPVVVHQVEPLDVERLEFWSGS